MSYILDALRKSDQERQRQAAPVQRSIHRGFPLPQANGGPRVRMLLLGVAIIAAAAAGAWFGARHWQGFAPPAVPAPDATPVVASADKGDVVASAGEAALLAAVAPPAPALEPAADTQAKAEAPATGLPEELLELWQLTEAEQRFLQGLEVSMHVYAADPARRTVIINGFRAREGQPLGQDLSLLEIVNDGIVVSFQNKRVHLSTVQGW